MLGALLVVAVVSPILMYSHGVGDSKVEALGAWFGAAVVLCVGLIAIPQLGLQRASVGTDIFLKATAIIDDEAKFGVNYDLARDQWNAARIKQATLSAEGSLVDPDGTWLSEKLSNAAFDVLSALEQVGIIFHYATNKSMIEEYVGDVVINAHEILSGIMKQFQKDDPAMYKRFDEMFAYCSSRWSRRAAGKGKYTNVRKSAG
jgi:hypothetical protein